ncbi:hypothetical protein A1Q1_02500 [Trichosporon asahii var. asahii CBS 2479]|uniref:Uncharacterized protein n=1 Tax=Trichosporon asahii var. asahii (strain ATCC 90039 / CBS 2479 / JCM 2466 / KCTC 7840 / NBRC 103889/ NCYC 2677 / UAMH 7654) TaxID=1186058 RepID=J6EV75_TRIAS|nr:hypothetical protein A1Q1_02500 [Trichosporon asahii var. asahii CBS 2479]EJT48479.1 hypothetical protein A1Q1_02500 [Trichosporon asahii var. asahii CBS 2479]
MMDPLIPFARSTPSLTSGTSDTPSIPMTDDSGLGTLRPRSPALIEFSDDGNPDPPRKPLAYSSGAGVTPAEKLRSLLRQMESDVRDPPPPPKPTPTQRRPATPQLIDAPIPTSNSNARANDEENSEEDSPPTPPPRIHSAYNARHEPDHEPEAGPSRPRRLPSRAVALQAAMNKMPEEKASPAPSALETFIAKHHETPEAWKPKHSGRTDWSTSRADSSATVQQFPSSAPRRRHAARRTTIEAPPDDSLAFAEGIQDPSIDMDDDSSLPAGWEEESSGAPDRSRGSSGRRSDRSTASADDPRRRFELDDSVDASPERPKNRFQTRRFIKADLSDELPDRPEPPRRSHRSTRSESPTEPESRTVRAERQWTRTSRSPTASFATAPQINPSTSLDMSLPQIAAESSDEDSGAMRNRASMFRPSSESPKSRSSESPKSRILRDPTNRTTGSSAYVDATSRSRDWASQVSKSQPYESFDDEVDRSLDEPEPPKRFNASRSRSSPDDADDRLAEEPEPPRRFGAHRRQHSQHSHDDLQGDSEPPRRLRASQSRDSIRDAANEPESPRRLRASRSRELQDEVDDELDEPEPPRRLRHSRSRELVQIEEEETVERSVDEDAGAVRVSRSRDMTTRYMDGSTEERHQSSQSIYEPLRWSQSRGSIEEPSLKQSRSRYDTPDESHGSVHSGNRYATPDESRVSDSRSRYDTPEEPSLKHSSSRYDAPEEPSMQHSRSRSDKMDESSMKHSRGASQSISRHSRSRYDNPDDTPPLRQSRSKEELAAEASRTSMHASQLRGFSFPRKRTRSDEAESAPAPPTPSPPKPLESSYLRPQKAAAALNTPVRPSGMRASALRKSARATPTPNRVRWSPDVEGGHISPPQSSFQFTAPKTTTPPKERSTTPPPSTSPPTSPPRTPAPPAPVEQSPLQPLATPVRGGDGNSSLRTPHPPGWFPATPLGADSGPSSDAYSTPAQASKTFEPGSAMRTPHPPGWFNPAAAPSTPGAKFFVTPAPKEKQPEKQEVRGVGVGAGFTTPLQPQQPYPLATPKPPGAWGWTPAAGSRLRNEITLDSSQSSAESSFERSLLGNGDVHRLRLSPKRKPASPKASPSTSPQQRRTESKDDSFEEVSLTTPKKGSGAWPPNDPPTPLSERLLNQSVAEDSFMDDSFLQADTSVMARVRSFLSPSKDADLRSAREKLEAATARSQASRKEIEDAQKAWLAALSALPAPSTSANAGTSTSTTTVVEIEKPAVKEKKEWPWIYWVIIALVEITVMWAVFRVTVDWVDAERSRTSSALVRRLPSGLGVFRRNARSSNLFDILELLGLRWAPQERRWNVPT